jgi:hypothetical protein
VPLIVMRCKRGWRLPDYADYDPARETNQQLAAINLIAYRVTTALPAILNELDQPDELLGPDNVVVEHAYLHGASLNAAEVQLMINPGAGDPTLPDRVQRERRTRIFDHIERELAKLREEHPEISLWPSIDVEVTPTNMTGGSIGRDGRTSARWGRPKDM